MIFDKLFKKKSIDTTLKQTPSTPTVSYVHTASNRNKVVVKDNDVIVLWWIANKKKGYDKTTNKYPKWFEDQYGITFNTVMEGYIKNGCLSENANIVKISQAGEEKLREFDYVIFVHKHPQYCLELADFKNSPNLHMVQNSDIAWGIFNSRILEYMKKGMWTSLEANYGNMADLLVEEKKYDKAIEFIFATAFIGTSGMRDNNELTPIMSDFASKKKHHLENGMPDIFLLEINNYYVTVPFLKVQENLNLDWKTIKEKYLKSELIASLERILPFRYFEKEQSFEIFKQTIEAGDKKGVFRLADCSKKLKSNTPDEHSSRYFYASVENQINREFGR